MTKIGFVCSCFDLLHAGHMLMLKECKQHCDILYIGLQTDPTIDRPTKNKSTQSYFERFLIVSGNKYIDEIFPYETEADLLVLIKWLKPDIRFLGEDYIGKDFTAKELDIPIHHTQRYGFSTSELRERIKHG